MKTCSKCGETKPVTEFYKRGGKRNGLQPHCKACNKANATAWYADNAEKVSAASLAWRSANPERHKANANAWAAANKDRRRATIAAWAKANPEACRIKNHNRRARVRENGGRLSNGLAAKLLKLQRGKCACCGVKLTANHLDHRIPVALGGPNEDWNMQLLCPPCNLQKGAKHPIDFMQQRGFLL